MSRYFVVVAWALAGWGGAETGQMPEPERVREFVEYMNGKGVQPLLYLVDPKLADPNEGDANRIRRYPPNVFIMGIGIEDFMSQIPNNQEVPYPIAYVDPVAMMPWATTILSTANDNFNNPNRLFYKEYDRRRHHFDPFRLLEVGHYDPVANRFHRVIYDWRSGEPIPKGIDFVDFREMAYQVLDALYQLPDTYPLLLKWLENNFPNLVPEFQQLATEPPSYERYRAFQSKLGALLQNMRPPATAVFGNVLGSLQFLSITEKFPSS